MCKLDCCCRFLIAIVSIPFMLLGLAILIVVGLVKSTASSIRPLINSVIGNIPFTEVQGMKLDLDQAIDSIIGITESMMDYLIIIGVVIFVISLIGVIAGCGRKPIILYVHAAITLLVGFILLVVCVYYGHDRAVVINEITTYLQGLIQNKYVGDLSFDIVSVATTVMNIFLNCCGAQNGTDFAAAKAWKYRTLNVSQFVGELPAFKEIEANKAAYEKYKDANTGEYNVSNYTPTDGSIPISQKWLDAIVNGTITLQYPLSCCNIDVDNGNVDKTCILQEPNLNNSFIGTSCVSKIFGKLEANEQVLKLVLILTPGLPLLLGALAIIAACMIKSSGD